MALVSELTHQQPDTSQVKADLREFLLRNPFPRPYTLGFYYREKMRAIHAVAPQEPLGRILEIGGGVSGLTSLLFPRSEIVNIDMDPACGARESGRPPFICGDAVRLPFRDEAFDAVTMFDVLEHVPDDRAAASEVLRVLKPGGVMLVSTPNRNWRFPYYRPLKAICPTEEYMMSLWGHVRRGYTVRELENLFGVPGDGAFDFINRLTVVSHDVAFSRLPGPVRRIACVLLWPLTWLGYLSHGPKTPGTETASRWRKPADPVSHGR